MYNDKRINFCKEEKVRNGKILLDHDVWLSDECA